MAILKQNVEIQISDLILIWFCPKNTTIFFSPEFKNKSMSYLAALLKQQFWNWKLWFFILITVHHLVFITYCSSHAVHHMPFITCRSSHTHHILFITYCHHILFLTHRSSHTVHHISFITYRSSHTVHHILSII